MKLIAYLDHDEIIVCTPASEKDMVAKAFVNHGSLRGPIEAYKRVEFEGSYLYFGEFGSHKRLALESESSGLIEAPARPREQRHEDRRTYRMQIVLGPGLLICLAAFCLIMWLI